MRMRYFNLLLLLTLMLGATGLSAQQTEKISPSLRTAFQERGQADFLVVLKAQAELPASVRGLRKEERGWLVYEAARNLAERTQPRLREMLKQRAVPYQPYWVVNAVRTQGDEALARAIAALPEVAQLQLNPRFQLDVQEGSGAAISWRNDAVEWGIEKIGADQVWELGFTGQGVVIGGQDTGYEWNHPALKTSYRGWDGTQADHNYNWHDAIHEIDSLNGPPYEAFANPCGLDSAVPCDDNNHGTHTMGTMAGQESGEGVSIGVAPDARWIGCRNMERGWGSPASYLECFEWFLAPTNLDGEAPNPALAPHIINNSWACPAIEGCVPENFDLLATAVNNLRAAGILVVVSAGNSGSNCGTISTPAAIFPNSFTVGATRQNDTIANFSSRGVVTIDSSGRLKPNVAAPGVGIRSAIRSGGYASLSGTSMAGPHVAGAAALLISANPQLAGQVELIEEILQNTAKPMLSDQDCGGVPGTSVPNAVYGFGRIDVLAAVEAALGITDTEDAVPENSTMLAFPNPADGTINLQLSHMLQTDGLLRLFDAKGQLLRQQPWPVAQPLLLLNLEELPAGIYSCQLTEGDKVWATRFIKK